MNDVRTNIDHYYTEKIKKHGQTPQGVDWNNEAGQLLRFEQLSKVISKKNFTLADIGCGYGKYNEYLEKYHTDYDYIGYDLSREMIVNAKKRYKSKLNLRFQCVKNLNEITAVDFCIASGIFSVKMEYTEAQWLSHILETLDAINEKSKHGFSFNMLTKYSDAEKMKNHLYYADPLFIFDYCKRNYSKNICLNHAYNLYEFTIIVKKD